jgi:hypothetical protein
MFGILGLVVVVVTIGGLEMMVFCGIFIIMEKWSEFSSWLVMVYDVQF